MFNIPILHHSKSGERKVLYRTYRGNINFHDTFRKEFKKIFLHSFQSFSLNVVAFKLIFLKFPGDDIGRNFANYHACEVRIV